jgi:uncharacterized iron-regulated membrane protein
MPQSPGEMATATARPVAPIPPQQLGDLFARSLAVAGLIGLSLGCVLLLSLVAWLAHRLKRIEGKIDAIPRPPERPD